MSYAELFCQSNFSFLTGASHPEELVQKANELNYQALAITDECSVAGVVRAHSEIDRKQLAIELIIGSVFHYRQLTFILLCPDRKAYGELCRIISNARRRSAKGEYQLSDWDIMSIQHCLLIWIPKGEPSVVEDDMSSNSPCTDEQWGQWLTKYHGSRLWIGYTRYLKASDHTYQAHCQRLAKLFKLPITACGGVLMHDPCRLPLQHTLAAIAEGKIISQLGQSLLANAEYALRPLNKLTALFPQAWLDEAVNIAKRCRFKLTSLRYEYPQELVPKGQTAIAYLKSLVKQGAHRRFGQCVPKHIQEIINKELRLIEELDYAYYFITIYDVVRFAKQQQILYQGRGSAANSVVCYCLEITSVDPRQIAVLFERFISKERNEPPDIDVDFEHQRREEVIQYIYQKYGRERTAIAATVITYRLKSAIREVGKALGFNVTQLEFLINNINRRDNQQCWQSQLVELGIDTNATQGRHLVELVEQILGFPRHLSQHVGGFVISNGPLYELVPVENAAMEQRTVIQWDKDDLQSLGLLKVDILALGMLTAISKCFTEIEQHYQQSLSIADITHLADDKQVYHMLQKADTVGVFQIESRAQMSMLPRLKPATYYDLVIQIAIVRPGPIQGNMVHPYLKRRNGQEPVEYPSPEVKEVLERTLGVPIFQEQVIKLAMVAAGFSGGEADQLRRAMARWKKDGKLLPFRQKLVSGMLERGYPQAFAERLFEQIQGFGEYGFPESHSASFAVLAYVSAWLKYYYPAAFYASILNSLPMGFYSASQLVQDAKRHGVEVLPVCVNDSQYEHILVLEQQKYVIRLGFRLIKGLSKQSATALIAHRPVCGYQNIQQIKAVITQPKDLQQLASSNALASILGDRYQSRWAIMNNDDQLLLLSNVGEPKAADYGIKPSAVDSMTEDYQALGLTLDKHPITLLDEAGYLGRFCRMQSLADKAHKSVVTVIGLVSAKQSPGTAAGVTFITLEDDTGNINVVVWAATARAQKQPYLRSKILKVTGILEREGEVTHVIAGKLVDISDCLPKLGNVSREFH
ncbi:error-prone DNA polymerase [Thalassotalea ponticola]|uniref:error-prone DNA polymerase n=1 Tax=Thalassotalea ponticola TaxID=1523392 RepID=UPI0025B450B0|nr:error-prone DNA polymerase [Thalassotalea ponticola]MDN3651183.1 error-prone DNA polymerase [Thalassotalea ponticola]